MTENELRALLDETTDPLARQYVAAELMRLEAGRLERIAGYLIERGHAAEGASDLARARMHTAQADSIQRRLLAKVNGNGHA